jgi:hypothetical protein
MFVLPTLVKEATQPCVRITLPVLMGANNNNTIVISRGAIDANDLTGWYYDTDRTYKVSTNDSILAPRMGKLCQGNESTKRLRRMLGGDLLQPSNQMTASSDYDLTCDIFERSHAWLSFPV